MDEISIDAETEPNEAGVEQGPELEDRDDNSAHETVEAAVDTNATLGEAPSPGRNGTEFALLVVLQPEGVRHRVVVTEMETLNGLIDMLCRDLRLQREALSFPMLQLVDSDPDPTLEMLGLVPRPDDEEHEPTLEAMVSLTSRSNTSNENYVMPDRIRVQVFDDTEHRYRTITVSITKANARKPYLGGFRHRQTLQIFHHAFCQTDITRARKPTCVRSHRETQTHDIVTRSIQTTRESGTQMARSDLHLDCSRDRNVFPKPYLDSFQLHCMREDAILVIQRCWRGYQARAYVHALREQRRRVAAIAQLENQMQAADGVAKQKQEINRRMHPTIVRDFEILYNELDKWRGVEIQRIQSDSTMHPDAQQEALQAVLSKETKLLQTIDRLKLSATDSNRAARIESMLRFLARPKQWQMSDGTVRDVHTQFTIRAQELMDLYHGLQLPQASVDERLDILLHVKWTVQEFDTSLTQSIIELVDREADLLQRGRQAKSLEGLRKRLQNLFLQFVKDPQFNPEATSLHT